MALPHPHAFIADEFLALDLPERVELINGVICDMAPETPYHADAQADLLRALFEALPGYRVLAGGTLQVTEDFCPIPDVAVFPRGHLPTEGYRSGLDALLVVEVGVSTAHPDRTIKVPAYAAGGVREVWLVTPLEGTLTIHRDPADGVYRDVSMLRWPGEQQPAIEGFVARLGDGDE